ncbi:phage baseplate assembly protein V [[Limnothrix rosea] IAM M-220]|uniref:phage baseplate assembly protein V n=1 Tax=[Limnothrix rosea] IAM M-220 TaxID=454133 RepID=UPI0009690193|nr:phage baseplate assembly protein V [[Limnothrix rosea] IAM M-220]OKH18096.1 phage tail protein [[Limnothrix rosea] IAM M-220]
MIGLDLLAPEQPTQKIYGMVIGIVTNNQDPEKLGRVKVKFPWLTNAEESKEGAESDWARIVMPMAGGDRGLYMLPEIEDEVLVAFEQGNISQPYVMGVLWNGVDKPPIEKEEDEKNDLRVFKSRNGNKVIFDDTEGKERIVIQDKLGKNKVVIQDTIMVFNDKAKELKDLEPDKAQITLDASTTPVKITVGKDQDFLLEGTGNITLKNPDKDFEIECKNFTLKTSADTTIEAGGAAGITGDKAAFEGKSGMDLKCSSGVKVNSSSLEVM